MPISKKNIGIALTFFLLAGICYYFSDIIAWVILGWVISLIGSPLMKLLGRIQIGKRPISSSIRALITLLVFYLIAGAFISIFIPVVIQQGRNLANVDYVTMMNSLEEPISHVNDWMVENGIVEDDYAYIDSTSLPEKSDEESVITTFIRLDSLNQIDSTTRPTIQLNIVLNTDELEEKNSSPIVNRHDHPIDKLKKQLFHWISPSQLFTKAVLYSVNIFGNFLILLTSVTFIAFFFLKDEKLFGNGIKIVVPNQHFSKTDHALKESKKLLTKYFTGIAIQISLILGFLVTLLSLVGIPNAFLISFFAAIINVIPYVGPILGAAFATLVTISSNLDADFYVTTLPMLYKVVGIFITMQLIDGFVLQPFIFSNSVSAHPLEIFIVVVVGAKLGGITGMVIAIPAYTIIRVVAAVFLKEFEIVRRLTDGISDDNPSLTNTENQIDESEN